MLADKILLYFSNSNKIYFEWTKFPISLTSTNTTNTSGKQHLSLKTNLAVTGPVTINAVM